MDITPYLDDLEQRLDTAVEDQLENDWQQFLDGKFTGHVFKPRRARQAPPTSCFPLSRLSGLSCVTMRWKSAWS